MSWWRELPRVRCPVSRGWAVKRPGDDSVTFLNFTTDEFPVCMFTSTLITPVRMKQGLDGVRTANGDFVFVKQLCVRGEKNFLNRFLNQQKSLSMKKMLS